MKYILLFFLIACQSKQKPLTEEEYLKQAFFYLKNKKFDTAHKSLEKCLKLNYKNSDCHWEIGWTYYKKPQWKKVKYHWEQSIQFSHSKKEIKLRTKFLDEAIEMAKVEELVKADQNLVEFDKKKKSFLTLSFAGDTMMGTSYPEPNLPQIKNNELFSIIKNKSHSDITFLNLEGPICDTGESIKCSKDKERCYSFRTPSTFTKYLKPYFNVVSLANNHIMDFGKACYDETVSHLEKHDIKYSDGFTNNAIFKYKAKEVIFVSFYTHEKYDHNFFNIKAAKKIIKNLKRKNKIIVVSFHAGAEGHKAMRIPFKMETYLKQKRGNVVRFSHAVIDAGADIVVGHGPHVLRGIEIYKKKIIMYSLGNFYTYGNFNLLGYLKYGALIDISIDENGHFQQGQVFSTIQKEGELKLDASNTSAKIIKALTDLDFPKHKIKFDNNYFFRLTPQFY